METATSIELFVEILDRYVYYFDQKNESVSGWTINCHRTLQQKLTRASPLGHHQVSEWSDRAHPLQPGWQLAGLSLGGSEQEALPPYPGDDQEQGVRRHRSHAQISTSVSDIGHHVNPTAIRTLIPWDILYRATPGTFSSPPFLFMSRGAGESISRCFRRRECEKEDE